MPYWNSPNFEGLKFLASTLRADPRLERLAAYCDLREQGLRRQAFAQLDAFLSEAASWDVPVQRALALQVLDVHWKTPRAHCARDWCRTRNRPHNWPSIVYYTE
jgi:hypothetical protein